MRAGSSPRRGVNAVSNGRSAVSGLARIPSATASAAPAETETQSPVHQPAILAAHTLAKLLTVMAQQIVPSATPSTPGGETPRRSVQYIHDTEPDTRNEAKMADDKEIRLTDTPRIAGPICFTTCIAPASFRLIRGRTSMPIFFAMRQLVSQLQHAADRHRPVPAPAPADGNMARQTAQSQSY